ncbi:hypothetical protein IWQ62_001421 [Dispira parvispora]|uniref:Uncharacterized protein n=1 Tax=Dispira parvispora TaxID=1520584 RepID=A0A9W8AYE0_9FUNG|nr:hypothetical protein IWQ62_001421 [Dispira parvispora]
MAPSNVRRVATLGLISYALSGFALGDYVSETLTQSGNYNPEFRLSPDYDYCNARTPTVEEYDKPMVDATLKLVQVVTRHGDRVPKNFLPGHREHWDCKFPQKVTYMENHPRSNSGAEEQGRLTSTNLEKSIALQEVMYTPKDSPYPVNFWGSCKPGQLTKKGMEQMLSLGENLRQIYVDKLGFLPQELKPGVTSAASIADNTSPYHYNPGLPIFIRSLNGERVQSSSQFLLTGLYPSNTRDPDMVVKEVVYTEEVESMDSHNIDCPKFKPTLQKLKDNTAWKTKNAQTKPLRERVNRVLKLTDDPRFQDMFTKHRDILMTQKCHGIPFPCDGEDCITEEDVRQIMTQATWEILYLRRDSNHTLYTRLAVGIFLGELAQRWDIHGFTQENTVKDTFNIDGDSERETKPNPSSPSVSSEPIFEIYSTRGSTMLFIAGLLKQKDVQWPSYASQLIFEFWDRNGETFVRVLHDGKPVQSDLCDFNVCPLEKFRNIMADYITYDRSECLEDTVATSNE